MIISTTYDDPVTDMIHYPFALGTEFITTLNFTSLPNDSLADVPWGDPAEFISGTFEVIDPTSGLLLSGEVTGIAIVPEPGTFLLAALGLLSLLAYIRRPQPQRQ